MVEILHWDVVVAKNPNPDEANDESLSWKVLNKIRFKSDDPANWGEFRAYGGSWTRVLNRSYDSRDIMLDAPPRPNPQLKSNPRRDERSSQLSMDTYLPFWGLPGPDGQNGWRIENDQHMEIFYAAVVKGVPRSDPNSRRRLKDDDNSPDDPAAADSPKDLDGLGSAWHIIGRDEPSAAPFQIGDFAEYWHRGEFQIRDPQTHTVLPQRKQIYLRVTGLFPKWKYVPAIDSTTDDLAASWELSISSSADGFKTRHYPARGQTLPK